MQEFSSSNLPVRKRPVHHPVVESGNRACIVFVTICTAKRVQWLNCKAALDAFKHASSLAEEWKVGCFVLMPDHVHFFGAPGVWPPSPLDRWLAYWKRCFSLALRKSIPDFKWQRDFWDTQLRIGDSYSEKWAYVRNNPVRVGLVHDAKEWPYQGELECLQWHD